MAARTLMVQGTASSVGKSLIVTALCRYFRQKGLRVAPYKAQNMALNSFVAPDGGEIGRSQAVQAEAAGIPVTVEMNPILLKPEGGRRFQVVLMGKSIGSLKPCEYEARKPEMRRLIAETLSSLRQRCDLVVIEGAGSPAEINLKDRDLVNMYVAQVADAPVLLVGNIDRGGVFASLVGTMELLDPHERARIAAFIINNFRGDESLLQSGLQFLTARTGVPVLGVMPHVPALRIADEDSVALQDRSPAAPASSGRLDIAVIKLPRIANFDDVQTLEHEPSVVVRFIETPEEFRDPDLVILPGTKSTVADLAWLRQTGLADNVRRHAGRGKPVLGICGGCQMLGQTIDDPHGIESPLATVAGLGLLPLVTRFERRKTTAQVTATVKAPSFIADEDCVGVELQGYEIHMGSVERVGSVDASFQIHTRNGVEQRLPDGAISATGSIVGTMIHGLFENDALRESMLRSLRRRRGLPETNAGQAPIRSSIPSKEEEYDRLAAALRDHLDEEMLLRIARIEV